MADHPNYPLRFSKNFPAIITALGALPRTGWVQWHITSPESVWEHTLATRELAISYQDHLQFSDEDFLELLDMIEIHDWPEAIVGDGVILGDEPDVDTLRRNKKHREWAAMTEICVTTVDGEKIIALYERYQQGIDRISQLAKQLDKLQAVYQAAIYEQTQSKTGLCNEFVHYTKDLIHDSFLINEFKKIAASVSKVNLL